MKTKKTKSTIKRKAPDNRPSVHYVHPYILDPVHPITINLIGVGGTGSMVLSHLARMHAAMLALGSRGLYVIAYDDDIVTDANMGRQLFSEVDIGQNKANILVSRVNRFFGTNWKGVPSRWPGNITEEVPYANITISCVDSVASRKAIHDHFKKYKREKDAVLHHAAHPYYHLDFGNSRYSGQVILSTVHSYTRKEESEFNHVGKLSGFFDLYSSTKDDPGSAEPSCSLAEALHRQSLFINSTLANYGAHLLWELFWGMRLEYHGVYINLSPLAISTIPIKSTP